MFGHVEHFRRCLHGAKEFSSLKWAWRVHIGSEHLRRCSPKYGMSSTNSFQEPVNVLLQEIIVRVLDTSRPAQRFKFVNKPLQLSSLIAVKVA